MSVCLDETPFMSGQSYVEHMLICPYKEYANPCPKLINSIVKNSDLFCFSQQIKRAINKINERYLYMLTFTVDLSKKTIETEDDIKEIEDYIIKLLRSKSLKHILRSHIVYEVGDNGNHHWHVYAECSKCLKKDRFKTYIKRYGNIDISRNKTDNEETILSYMAKSNIPRCIKSPSSNDI